MAQYSILHLEDSKTDSDLVQRILRRANLDFNYFLATDRESFLHGINEFMPDVILSDHTLPHFDSKMAFEIYRAKNLDIPFILVTGTVSEEFSVEMMKAGVDDYLLKSNLQRLPLAIINAFEKRENDRKIKAVQSELKLSESQLRTTLENSSDCLLLLDKDFTVIEFNNQLRNFTIAEWGNAIQKNKNIFDLVPPTKAEFLRNKINIVLKGEKIKYETDYPQKDGTTLTYYVRINPIPDTDGKVKGVCVNMEDITERKKEEERLKLLETVIINTTDAVIITEAFPYDPPGPKVLYVNDSFYKITGYSKEEIIGQTPRILQGANTDKNELMRLKKSIENNLPCEIEIINYKKNGEEFWTSLNISPVLNQEGVPVYWVGIKRDITESKRHEQDIKKAIISAQEKQQYFIGRELHDNIAQILVGALITIGMVKENDPKQNDWINQTKEGIHNSIHEIRKLSHRLAPAKFEGDNFIPTIQNLLKSVNTENRYKIITHFDNLDNANLNSELQLNLYRILQEQLQNIIKHANATEIEISIRLIENMLRLRIFDNGQGFNTATLNDGIGLRNIKNRAEIFSGFCIIKSSPGKGCELLIKIPLR
ncbi:signal transduction histidine-protein kinase/phosphatase DegS [mine drainage metagenome]|uniref:histidine kinase n=1 Tax=mine drainage metagenome TaxID=410659 RepID=A0A1J5SLH8_9ZZZZ